MSIHSYTSIWVHLTWSTRDHANLLTESAARQVEQFLRDYAKKQGIYLLAVYVNPDHVHILIDLPVHLSIADIMKGFKGASSHWINHNDLVPWKFSWSRGYGGFSVSHSERFRVARYIENQREHHRTKSYAEEIEEFRRHYDFFSEDR